jgi:hypothetical protein
MITKTYEVVGGRQQDIPERGNKRIKWLIVLLKSDTNAKGIFGVHLVRLTLWLQFEYRVALTLCVFRIVDQLSQPWIAVSIRS